MRRRHAVLPLLLLGFLLGADRAAAAPLPPCGTVTSALFTLTGNCAAPLVIAKTGARVDLGGHYVTCTDEFEGDWSGFADTRPGIRITGRRAVRLSNGNVTNCGRGISITGGRSNRITNVRVMWNGDGYESQGWGTGAGIVIDASTHNIVERSTISENFGPGITLLGAADRNRIVGNTLTNDIGSVLLSGSRNYVDSNVISYSTGEWTPAIGGGNSSVIRWNRVDRTSWRETGVGISAGYAAIVRANEVTRSDASGIQVVGAGAQVLGNTVTGNVTSGWNGCGIEVWDTAALVEANTVTGNLTDGICTYATGGRIRNNVTGGNGGADLRDWGGCLANLWQNNAFTTRFPACLS